MPFNITSTGGSGSGAPGPRGPQGLPGAAGAAGAAGADGTDALWNYLGEYDGGVIYAAGDVVTYNGQLWYRNVYTSAGYVPGGENTYWDLLAAKGADGADGSGGLVYLGDYVSGNGYVADLAVVRGSDNNLYIAIDSGGLQDPVGNTGQWDIFSTNAGGNADIADFVFDLTEANEEEEISARSTMTIHNHDMLIRTTRDDVPEGEDLIDADVRIISADDVSVEANDEVLIISLNNGVSVYAGSANNEWVFQSDAGLRFPDQTIQTTAYTGDEEFTLEPYGFIDGDSEPAGENRVVNLSYTFSEGPIDGIPVAANNNNALYVPINNEAFEDIISYQINSQLSDLSVTLNDQTVLSVDGFASGVYDVNEENFPAGIVVLDDYITKTAEEIYPFVLTATRTYPGVTNSITISVNRDVEGPETDWVFDSDGNLITPSDSPRIVNTAVPGNITLSAFSGVELSFADVPGAGLTFPDQTIQTTAYTGGAGADTGDITFVDNTISSDTGDDIVIQNKNDDGIVKARITLDQSDEKVLIEAIASDNDWFNDTQWSTAVWSGSVVTITNTPDIINFFNNVTGNVNRVSINDGGLLTYEGASFSAGNMTLNVGGTPVAEEDPLTVTEIRFYYELVSEINIDYDDGEFNIISRGMSMAIDSSGELDLKARSEDLHLYANDDVRFTANWDNNGTEYSWRMSESGKFELPGDGYIENPTNSSSDNGSSDTIKIVPDSVLIGLQYHEDQFLVIDPTGPNHIHIRAGGEIDSSSADLILGGERNQVLVSDTNREVKVGTAKQETINTYLNTNTENSTLFITDMSADISYGARVNIDGLDFTVDSITGDTPSAGLMTVSAGGATFTGGQTYTFVFDGNGDNEWTFGTDGYLYGPVNGNLGVASIYGLPNTPLEVDSQHSVVLKGYNGEYLNGISSENQIATVGDFGYLDIVSETDPLEGQYTTLQAPENMVIQTTGPNFGEITIQSNMGVKFLYPPTGGVYLNGDANYPETQVATIGDITTAVGVGGNGEVTRWTPNFTATGLTFTGSGATHPAYNSHYVKNGRMVSFNIEVDLSTVTNFGTGQYKLQLPFTPQFGFNHFSGWIWADPNVDPDTGTGHTILNADTAGITDVLDLHYLKQGGGANSPIREGLFLQGTPVTLSTISKIYINGTYITAS